MIHEQVIKPVDIQDDHEADVRLSIEVAASAWGCVGAVDSGATGNAICVVLPLSREVVLKRHLMLVPVIPVYSS